MWDKVSCGFDVEEETRNFGTRAVALGEEAVFESSTLAVIESSNQEELNIQPWCISKYHCSGFAIVLDSSLLVFNNSVSQLIFTFDFGHKVEDIEWIDYGSESFILIGLSNSTLFAVHCQTETLFKISNNLDSSNKDDVEQEAFYYRIKSYCRDNILDVVIVTSYGQIIRMSGACLNQIVEQCKSSDDIGVKRKEITRIIENLVKFTTIQRPSSTNLKCKIVESLNPGESGLKDIESILVILYGNTIQEWSMSDSLILRDTYPLGDFSSGDIQIATMTPDQQYILCLLRSGGTLYISMNTFECIALNDRVNVLYMTLVGAGTDYKILTLTKDSIDCRSLILTGYPDGKPDFNLSDICDCALPFGLNENIYYLEQFGDKFIETVKIKSIVESEPKFRLERLLQRGKFAEAEAFSRCFNLSMVEVNQCKAKKLADDISVWQQSSMPEEEINLLFENLISVLDEVDDEQFVVELCVNTVPCRLELIEKLLKYSQSRICQPQFQVNEKHLGQIERIFNLNKLFRTFTKLKNISHSPTAWAEFSSKNFFKDCQNYISKGDVGSAITLCSGHWDNISKELTAASGISLYTLLPIHIPHSDLFLWLKFYTPLFFSLEEDGSSLFLQWISEIINVIACIKKNIEMCYDLVNEVLEILHSVNVQKNNKLDHSRAIRRYLIDTANTLKKIVCLKREHNVIIPFDRMPSSGRKEEKVEFIRGTLQNVPFGGMKALVQYFVLPFCSEHSLKFDDIVINFIQGVRVVGFSKEEWESRCINYAEMIFNKQKKLDVMLYILREASVPWSETICELEEKLRKTSVKSYRSEVLSIKERSVMQSLLLQCGLSQYHFQNINYKKMDSFIKYVLSHMNSGNEVEIFDSLKQLGQVRGDDKILLKICCGYICRSLSIGTVVNALNIIEHELNEENLTCFYEWAVGYLGDLFTFNPASNPAFLEIYKEVDVVILLSRLHEKLPRNKVLPMNFLEIVNTLCTDYSVMVQGKSFQCMNNKVNLLKKCVDQLLENAKEEIPSHYVDRVKSLAKLLDLPVWQCYYELSMEAINSMEFCIAAEGIRCLIGENDIGVIPIENIVKLAKKVLNSHNLQPDQRNLYSPLKALLKSSFLSVRDSDALDYLGQLEGVSVLLELVHKDVFKKPTWYTGPMYLDSTYPTPEISSQTLQILLKVLTEEVDSSAKSAILMNNNNFLSDLLKKMPHNVSSIGVALRLRLEFPDEILSEMEIKQVKTIVTKMVSNTLLKVIHSNSCHTASTLSLLNYFPTDQALKWIDNVLSKTETFRLHSLSQIAKTFCCCKDLPNQWQDYSQLCTISVWDRKFQKFGISFEGIFNDDNIKGFNLKTLMKLPDFNCFILEEYCSSFNCDIQQYLLFYLSQALMLWKMDYVIEEEGLILKNSYEDLYHKCQDIASKIIDSSSLVSCILGPIWNQINPYYYEVFLVIINLVMEFENLEENIAKELSGRDRLLKFLISYKRIGTPGEYEQSSWQICDDYEEHHKFEIISKYRLPFKALPEIMDIIGPELTLDNYKQWLQIPFWFGEKLSSDFICALTIKNLKNLYTNCTKWDLQLKRKDVLDKIEECISLIETYELATSTFYFVVNYVMPPGADQVEAAQLCLFKALDWKEKEVSDRSQVGYLKAEKKYFSVSLKHTLHKYNLAKNEYLDFANQPVELINALYHDPGILDDFRNPGVNEAAATIAKLYNDIDMLSKIKKELLFKWISENCDQTSEDDIFEMDFELYKKDDSQNLKRAVYMLNDIEDKEVYTSLLMHVIFPQEEFSKPVGMRLGALQILLSIVSPHELHTITGRSRNEIMKLVKNLQFVYDLERVGIFYTVSIFEEKDKNELIADLLMNLSPKKCVVAANIAVQYTILSKDVWNRILEFLTMSNMINELKKYLIIISRWSLILNINILISAWNALVLSYASKANSERNDSDLSNLLSNCPILDKLDLSDIHSQIIEQIK